MKTIVLSLITVFLGWFAERDGLTISDEKVMCVISRATTPEQLKAFKTELWEKKKITFDVEQMDLSQNGLIQKLKISVDCHDGFRGSAQTVFKDKKSKLSFYRVYESEVDSPFGIGRSDAK